MSYFKCPVTPQMRCPVNAYESFNGDWMNSGDQKQKTVLLVDDDDLIIDVGSQMIEALGFKVVVAKSGEEALVHLNQAPGSTDLIVLDLIMPDMGGGEAFDRIKQAVPDAKVLLSSGYSINGEARQILDKGCDGFIQKPFSLKDLSEKINEILGQT